MSEPLPLPFHPDAADELVDAYEYIDGEREGFGEIFRAAIILTLRLGFPLPDPRGNPRIHRYLEHRFHYTLWVADRPGLGPIVLAVAHQRRKPDYWRHRLQDP